MSFLDGNGESFLEDIQTAVVGQLEIVHAGHDTREVIIWGVRRLARAANHREDGRETLETCAQKTLAQLNDNSSD